MNQDQEIVQVQHLTKTFKTVTAVQDLSFTVHRGDIYGFLGQNGAGKSTTMRMMLSLIKPTSGEIRIFGKSIEQDRTFILQQIGAMIERPDLYKYLSAYDNLKIFAQLSNASDAKSYLMKQLAVVGLEHRAHDKVGGFSQGMKQRLGIAIALVHNPALVILDEPSNGLDPQGIVDIRNLILHLAKEEGKTVIVSSHLLSEMEQIASRILIVDKGKKIVEGSTQVLMDPEHSLVKIKVLDVEKTRNCIAASQFNLIQIDQDNTLEFSIAKRDIPLLNRYLVENQIDVYSIQQMNNLEKYFLQLTTNQHVQTV